MMLTDAGSGEPLKAFYVRIILETLLQILNDFQVSTSYSDRSPVPAKLTV